MAGIALFHPIRVPPFRDCRVTSGRLLTTLRAGEAWDAP